MSSLNSSARAVLLKCMGLKKSEKCLVVADSERKAIGKAFLEEAGKIARRAEIEIIPVGKVNGEEPPKRVAEKMAESDVIIIPTTKSLSWTRARAKASAHGARIASMPSITEKIMRECICIDYNLLKKVTSSLAARLKGSGLLRITSPKGTDISLSVRGRKWLGNDAGIYCAKGSWGNLPAGEVFTSPVLESVSGILVVDASMAGIGRLKKPIRIEIRKGYAARISGGKEAAKFRKMLESVKDRNAFAVAEVGIGTNSRAKVIGTVLEDEKAMGTAHIAFGNSRGLGGKVDVRIHVDGVFVKPTVYADGEKIIKEGRLLSAKWK